MRILISKHTKTGQLTLTLLPEDPTEQAILSEEENAAAFGWSYDGVSATIVGKGADE